MFRQFLGGEAGGAAAPPRRASHAGSWYDDDPRKLGAAISRLFASVNAAPNVPSGPTEGGGGPEPRRVLGLIGPHAGLRFCGETSAHAYHALRAWLYSGAPEAERVQRVFLLGPSHHKWIDGVELSAAGFYETPFGALGVDHDALAEVAAACKARGLPCARMDRATDEAEHSLELHLPLLSHVLHFPPKRDAVAAAGGSVEPLSKRVRLVPMIVGGGVREAKAAEVLGEVLSAYYGRPENIFVVSSDFCHWGARFRYTHHFEKSRYPCIGDAIEAMDRRAMALIAERDIGAWTSYLHETNNTICGSAPISAALWAMRRAEPAHHPSASVSAPLNTKISFVHYSQSNRCKDATDSSVSYASAVFTAGD